MTPSTFHAASPVQVQTVHFGVDAVLTTTIKEEHVCVKDRWPVVQWRRNRSRPVNHRSKCRRHR